MKKNSRSRKKQKKKKSIVGRSGPHHEISPMGHATRTKSKQEVQEQEDRKSKQQGWDDA